MKRMVMILCIAALLLQGVALAGGGGLQAETGSMYFSDEWNGEASDTHAYLIVETKLVNWSTDELVLSEEVSADISYQDIYVFEGELCFPHETIGQLVELNGQLAFALPNVLTEVAPEELTLTLRISGDAAVVPISIGGQRVQAGSGRFEGSGYDTPEEAIAAYIDARRASDIRGMISTFAVETYVDAYDQRASLARIGVFSMMNYANVPIASEYARQLLISQRAAEISDALYHQYLMYMWPSEGDSRYDAMVRLSSEEEIDALLESLSDAERTSLLTDVELIDFVSIEALDAVAAEDYYDEAVQNNLAQRASMYNCDELAERIAHVRAGGEEGYQLMQCARYGDRWYNATGFPYMAMCMGMDPNAYGYIVEGALN